MQNLTDNRSSESRLKHMDRHGVTILGLFCAFRVMIVQNIFGFVNRTDRQDRYSNWPACDEDAKFLFGTVLLNMQREVS